MTTTWKLTSRALYAFFTSEAFWKFNEIHIASINMAVLCTKSPALQNVT